MALLSTTLKSSVLAPMARSARQSVPCAAKLLHDTLFQDNDPGTRNLVSKFLQECQFLSTINRPNIVQYLSTASDPDGADGREFDQVSREVDWSPPLPLPAQHLP